MKSPTKRKKAGLICPVDAEPPKKTQAQIKREQREAADQKTKELLKNNPTYEQLAKVLHKVLLKQEALMQRDEKLKDFESDIALFSRFIDDPTATRFIRGVFIQRSVALLNRTNESEIGRLILKGMDLRLETRNAEAASAKAKASAVKKAEAEAIFRANPNWANSKHSHKRLAELMIREHKEEVVGKIGPLQRSISDWRKNKT
jgi:hypothetical protein